MVNSILGCDSSEFVSRSYPSAARYIQRLFHVFIDNSFVFVCISVVIVSSPLSAIGDEPTAELSLDKVISAIAASEERVDAVSFHCEVWNGVFVATEEGWSDLAGKTQLNTVQDNTGVMRATSDVLMKPHLGMYSVKRELLIKTEMEGATPEERTRFVLSRDNFSNDGVQFRKQTKVTATRVRPESIDTATWNKPEEWKGEGFIDTATWNKPKEWKFEGLFIDLATRESCPEQGAGFMKMHALQLGIGHVTPFVSTDMEPPQILSELLRAKKDGGDYIAARTTSSGLWEIFYSVKNTFDPRYAFRIFFDPVRGRIARCEQGGCKICKEYVMDDWFVSYLTDYRYANDAAVIPSVVTMVKQIGKLVEVDGQTGRKGQQWIYSNVVLNPSATETDFRMDFDNGIDVRDYVGGE